MTASLANLPLLRLLQPVATFWDSGGTRRSRWRPLLPHSSAPTTPNNLFSPTAIELDALQWPLASRKSDLPSMPPSLHPSIYFLVTIPSCFLSIFDSSPCWTPAYTISPHLTTQQHQPGTSPQALLSPTRAQRITPHLQVLPQACLIGPFNFRPDSKLVGSNTTFFRTHHQWYTLECICTALSSAFLKSLSTALVLLFPTLPPHKTACMDYDYYDLDDDSSHEFLSFEFYNNSKNTWFADNNTMDVDCGTIDSNTDMPASPTRQTPAPAARPAAFEHPLTRSTSVPHSFGIPLPANPTVLLHQTLRRSLSGNCLFLSTCPEVPDSFCTLILPNYLSHFLLDNTLNSHYAPPPKQPFGQCPRWARRYLTHLGETGDPNFLTLITVAHHIHPSIYTPSLDLISRVYWRYRRHKLAIPLLFEVPRSLLDLSPFWDYLEQHKSANSLTDIHATPFPFFRQPSGDAVVDRASHHP